MFLEQAIRNDQDYVFRYSGPDLCKAWKACHEIAGRWPAALASSFPLPDVGILPGRPSLVVAGEPLTTPGDLFLYSADKNWHHYTRQFHSAELRINMGAIAKNIRAHKALIGEGVKMAVMVKANAYGMGAVEVGRWLEARGLADYLMVAYVDEGVALRRADVGLPIMVLSAEPHAFGACIAMDLEPILYSASHIAVFIDAWQQQGAPERRVHIELNSGMNRLGLDRDEVESVGRLLKRHPQLRVASIFSHLSGSDDPQHDTFSKLQNERYLEAYAALVAQLGYLPALHLVNSNGIARLPQYHYGMVRLGIGAYGSGVGGRWGESLQTAVSLTAQVAQVRSVAPGETIGYARSGVAGPEGCRVATLSLGYADGLPRAAGQCGYPLMVNGRAAPLIGHVCMDISMLDVSGAGPVAAGDEVCVFGPGHKPEALAYAVGTIPYEVLTSIGPRVRRVWQYPV